MSRFGDLSLERIDDKVKQNVPINTVKSDMSVWHQFSAFCTERNYVLRADSTQEELADILKDWAYNMKKFNGDDYKESTVKTMWNKTAKLLLDKYSSEFNVTINPFAGAVFKAARGARDAKRKLLQSIPEKRKASAVALGDQDWDAMVEAWDEETPEGLQKKLFMIISVELAWRGGEGSKATVYHFREERKNDGELTGRIEYNPIFTKTTQGGGNKCADSKWLTENKEVPSKCPVTLFRKLQGKRNENIKTDRLFLTVNPSWKNPRSSRWYKDSPVGPNMIAKWVKESAEKAGLDVANKKITNHSSRATAVSNLAKSGVGEQQIIKITGHANTHSIQPYLQLDQGHHEAILKKLRKNEQNEVNVANNSLPPPLPQPSTSSAAMISNTDTKKNCTNVYNNCIFYSNTLNMN